MRDFVKTFFLQNESSVKETPTGLTVDLNVDMAAIFGQERLNLVFDAKDVDESSELVTHGSYVFNSIYEFLQATGKKVVGKLDERFDPDQGALLKKVHVENGEVRSFKASKEKTADLLFNFKVSYLSDDKSEEILSLGVDDHGVIFDATAYYTPDVLNEAVTALATKGSIDISRKAIEVQFRSCLKAASARASENGKAIQHDILKRLHHTVARLKGFYTAQIQELHRNQPSYEERRLLLEREYELKLKEEIDNHKLRIILKLLSYQIIERSEIRASMSLKAKNGSGEKPFQLVYDTFTGTLDYGECPTCRSSMNHVIMDAEGKIGCRNCVFICSTCKKAKARRAEPLQCHICESAVCEDCEIRCVSCNKTVCLDHQRECAIGAETVCADCSTACSVCGKLLCGDHTFACSATRSIVCFEDRVICNKCRRIYSKSYVKSLAKDALFCQFCNEPFQ